MFASSLHKVLGQTYFEDAELAGPTFKFKAFSDSVSSMVTTKTHLITASGSGDVLGWDWKSVTSNKASEKVSSLQLRLPFKE